MPNTNEETKKETSSQGWIIHVSMKDAIQGNVLSYTGIVPEEYTGEPVIIIID